MQLVLERRELHRKKKKRRRKNSLDPQRGALHVRKLPEARLRTTGR